MYRERELPLSQISENDRRVKGTKRESENNNPGQSKGLGEKSEKERGR